MVKNSFLELVETPFPHDTRNRSFTDGAIESLGRKDSDLLNYDTPGSDYYSGAQLQQQHNAYPVVAGNGTGIGQGFEHQVRLSQDNAWLAQREAWGHEIARDRHENGQSRGGLPLILENTVPSRQVRTIPLVEALAGNSSHPQGPGPLTAEMLARLNCAPGAWAVNSNAQCNSGGGQMREQPPNSSTHRMMPSAENLQYFQGPSQTQQLGRSQHFAAQSPGAVSSQQPRHETGNRLRKQGNNGVVATHPISLAFPSSHDVSDQYTTVMLRNLPNKYTRSMLLDMLDAEGFTGKFSFVYLPIDFKTHAGLGYAFVDLTSPPEAQKLRQHFEGFSRWVLSSDKVCTVSWSHPEQQGHAAHVERYRNSPVMHDSVPEDWKPVLFVDGRRVPFPVSTRKIRPPRLFPFKAIEK